MFKCWPMKAREIVDELCADPRFLDNVDGAMFYLVRMPDTPQVRLGWPPNKGKRNVPMAILYLENGGTVRLKVRVGLDTSLIGEGHDLYPSDGAKPGHPEEHYGNYILTSPVIPGKVFGWLKMAAEFVQAEYGNKTAKDPHKK
jgi:hypothetical protein